VALAGTPIKALFASQQTRGVCYRIPSVVRAGEFVAVLAAKRQGYSPEVALGRTPRRPVRLEKDKLQNATACGDEAFISIALRIARVERDSVTGHIRPPGELTWTPEIVVVDMGKYVTASLTPGSSFFDPVMYDYYLRLRNADFRYARSGYLACTGGSDCDHLARCAQGTEQGAANDATCRSLSGSNLFEAYMADSYPEASPLGDWLRQPENAIQLLNARFGSQGFTGVVDSSGNEWLGLTGIVAYPTVPHAAHNAYLDGDTMMKHGALRVNLRALWNAHAGQPETGSVLLDVDHPALNWKLGFSRSAANRCLAQTRAWLSTPAGQQGEATFNSRLGAAGFQPRSLVGPSGLGVTVAPPANLEEVLRLVNWFSRHGDPMGAVANLSSTSQVGTVLDVDAWKAALLEAYQRERMYPDILRDAGTRDQVLSLLQGSGSLTHAQLTQVHGWMGVPLAMGDVDNAPERRLAAVMSVYARLLNVRVNQYARLLHQDDDVGETDAGERASRLLFKSARFGPGNGLLLPSQGRVFLPIAGGFPLSVDTSLGDLDCGYDDIPVKKGSERQAAIIRRQGDDYQLFMTLRYAKVQSARLVNGVPQSFDLATWTRDLSVSLDSGRTWAGDSVLPPAHLTCSTTQPATGLFHRVAACSVSGSGQALSVRVTPEPEPGAGTVFLVERTPPQGFQSSQVQASVTSIPGFFGPGRALVLHAHPSTATRAIVETEDGGGNTGSEVVTCLGESPGDASKEVASRCDFRFNLTVTPGLPSDSAEPGTGAGAVRWLWGSSKAVHPGSAGYSAAVFVGRDGCDAATAAVAYEGTSGRNALEYRGFNNGVNVQFVRATGGDYTHLGACASNLDAPVDF
jgi:hypothetical protein